MKIRVIEDQNTLHVLPSDCDINLDQPDD